MRLGGSGPWEEEEVKRWVLVFSLHLRMTEKEAVCKPGREPSQCLTVLMSRSPMSSFQNEEKRKVCCLSTQTVVFVMAAELTNTFVLPKMCTFCCHVKFPSVSPFQVTLMKTDYRDNDKKEGEDLWGLRERDTLRHSQLLPVFVPWRVLSFLFLSLSLFCSIWIVEPFPHRNLADRIIFPT